MKLGSDIHFEASAGSARLPAESALPAPHSSSAGSSDELLERALSLYGGRVLDNIDLSKLASPQSRMRVVGRALMEKGDARAFVLGRRLLAVASA